MLSEAATRRNMGEAQENKVLYAHRSQRDSHWWHQEATRGDVTQAVGSVKQVGRREREGAVPFLRFREGTEQRVKGDLSGKSECPVVTVRGGEESKWWQGQPSRWCTWPSWRGVYTL